MTDRRGGVDEGALPDVLQFMKLLWAIAHALEQRSKRMARDIGVTGPQRLVLRVIGLSPGLSAGSVAGVLHIHPSTLTGMLRRLIAGGLVARAEHPDDRRRAVLHLTAMGTRINGARTGTVEAAVSAALAGISAVDRASAQRALSRVAAYLERSSPGPRRSSRQVR